MEGEMDFSDRIEEDLKLQTEAWDTLKKYEGIDPKDIPFEDKVIIALYMTRDRTGKDTTNGQTS